MDDDHQLPGPLWGSDVDLGCFADLEIPARWIGGREFAGMSDGARWSLFRLLKMAWHEHPAGSLPADQFALIEAAGLSETPDLWADRQAMVLRDWVLCSDERFYYAPWEGTILSAWDRRSRVRATKAQSQARARLCELLVEVGVPNVKLIPRRRIDELLEAWNARSGPEIRGKARRAAAIQLASDCGILPREDYGASGVADLRISRKFQTI